MHKRFSIEPQPLLGPRRTIDASWSSRRRALVAGGCVTLTLGALAAGAWAYLHFSPPALPTTAADAVAVLKSDKFSRMDELRQRQYAAEAQRLLRDMTPEERTALFRDPDNREAMGRLREEMMEEAARKYARGEPFEPFGPRPDGQRPGGPRPEGQRPPGMGPGGPGGETLTEEQRQERMKEMRGRMNERITQQFQTGNAQTGGLMGEMHKRRSAQRDADRKSGGR